MPAWWLTYYQHTLTSDNRGISYLKDVWGISSNRSITDFGVGYVNGTLLEILPEDNEINKTLRKIGLLNNKGHEALNDCVVFPLCDHGGVIVNLYGINIEEATGITHLYLPGARRGLVNRQAQRDALYIWFFRRIYG